MDRCDSYGYIYNITCATRLKVACGKTFFANLKNTAQIRSRSYHPLAVITYVSMHSSNHALYTCWDWQPKVWIGATLHFSACLRSYINVLYLRSCAAAARRMDALTAQPRRSDTCGRARMNPVEKRRRA